MTFQQQDIISIINARTSSTLWKVFFVQLNPRIINAVICEEVCHYCLNIGHFSVCCTSIKKVCLIMNNNLSSAIILSWNIELLMNIWQYWLITVFLSMKKNSSNIHHHLHSDSVNDQIYWFSWKLATSLNSLEAPMFQNV